MTDRAIPLDTVRNLLEVDAGATGPSGEQVVMTTMVLAGKTSSSTARPLNADAITRALMTIDFAHHEIHEGDAFMASFSGTGKNDGTWSTIYFKTPNTTKYLHMLMNWAASGAAYARIREGAVVTNNTGTNALAARVRNRNSATTSVIVDNALAPAAGMYATDVTIADRTPSVAGDKGGLVIWEEFSGAAKQAAAVGRNEQEIILKANTGYVFEVESDAAGLTLSLVLSWYEHTSLAD